MVKLYTWLTTLFAAFRQRVETVREQRRLQPEAGIGSLELILIAVGVAIIAGVIVLAIRGSAEGQIGNLP